MLARPSRRACGSHQQAHKRLRGGSGAGLSRRRISGIALRSAQWRLSAAAAAHRRHIFGGGCGAAAYAAARLALARRLGAMAKASENQLRQLASSAWRRPRQRVAQSWRGGSIGGVGAHGVSAGGCHVAALSRRRQLPITQRAITASAPQAFSIMAGGSGWRENASRQRRWPALASAGGIAGSNAANGGCAARRVTRTRPSRRVKARNVGGVSRRLVARRHRLQRPGSGNRGVASARPASAHRICRQRWPRRHQWQLSWPGGAGIPAAQRGEKRSHRGGIIA